MAISIIVADDHRLFRQGLIAQLQQYEDIIVIGEATNGKEALLLVEELKPDVLVLDLQMPLLNGYEVMEQLRIRKLEMKILVISSFVEEWHLSRVLEYGASGCLSKDADTEEVVSAIRSVYENGFYFSESTKGQSLTRLLKKRRFVPIFKNKKADFTDKEKKVLYMICSEYSNAEIAKMMYLSERTIEDIRKRMIRKAGVKNMIGLIVYAAQNEIINLDEIPDTPGSLKDNISNN